jgi:hypothetical protein
VRVELAELANATRLARYRRLNVDRIGRPVLLRIIHTVRGDPHVGEDSTMDVAMGYTAKGRRRKPGPKKKALRFDLSSSTSRSERGLRRSFDPGHTSRCDLALPTVLDSRLS